MLSGRGGNNFGPSNNVAGGALPHLNSLSSLDAGASPSVFAIPPAGSLNAGGRKLMSVGNSADNVQGSAAGNSSENVVKFLPPRLPVAAKASAVSPSDSLFEDVFRYSTNYINASEDLKNMNALGESKTSRSAKINAVAKHKTELMSGLQDLVALLDVSEEAEKLNERESLSSFRGVPSRNGKVTKVTNGVVPYDANKAKGILKDNHAGVMTRNVYTKALQSLNALRMYAESSYSDLAKSSAPTDAHLSETMNRNASYIICPSSKAASTPSSQDNAKEVGFVAPKAGHAYDYQFIRATSSNASSSSGAVPSDISPYLMLVVPSNYIHLPEHANASSAGQPGWVEVEAQIMRVRSVSGPIQLSV